MRFPKMNNKARFDVNLLFIIINQLLNILLKQF